MIKNDLKQLLILNMKRSIEILNMDTSSKNHTEGTGDQSWTWSEPSEFDKHYAELICKLHEIRRDSISFKKAR